MRNILTQLTNKLKSIAYVLCRKLPCKSQKDVNKTPIQRPVIYAFKPKEKATSPTKIITEVIKIDFLNSWLLKKRLSAVVVFGVVIRYS